MEKIDEKLLADFYTLFRGNKAFYVKHQPPFEYDEGADKVKGTWVGIAKDRSTKEILEVSKDKYTEHLSGGDGIAIEPLTEKNTCFLAAIDIDVHTNFTFIIQRLYEHGFKFAPFVSKSGGLHIYFFFMDEEKGKTVVETVTRFVEIFGLGRLFTSDKGKSKVEIFPKHSVLKPDSQGSCLFLPYYNAVAGKGCKQRMITQEGKLISLDKAIPMMQSLFTSCKEINAALDALPYGDAPYCVQMITLTGALTEGDGRNDFVYQAGVYLRKKQKENFLDELMKINNMLAEPQEAHAVESTYKSVTTKQLEYRCKSGPCAEYCDTKLCKLRTYGVGRDKANVSTGFACWGELSRVMAEEPYYIWKVQVDEEGKWYEIRLDGEADLMNQMVVAKACVRYANRAPRLVTANAWIQTVNVSLAGIESRQIEIPKQTDTTDMGALREYFMRYITHKRIQSQQPLLIRTGQVLFRENEKTYYFTTEGFMDFLRVQKFNRGRINLREELIRFGCKEGAVTYHVNSGDKEIKCWTRVADDETQNRAEFYDDITEIDAAAIQSAKLNKVDSDDASPQEVGGGNSRGNARF